MTTQNKEHKELVTQSNPLIEARKHMDLIQLRLFAIGLKNINPHYSKCDKFYDVDFHETIISPTELEKLFGNRWYLSKLEKACKNMIQAYIELMYPDGFTLYHIFDYIQYKKNEGLILKFDDKMKPFILDLIGKRYTKIPMKQIFSLSSTYSIRLLELLLQYQCFNRSILERQIDLDKLRFYLNIKETAYKRLADFKKRVLDSPIEEINKNTDYTMWYENIKKGRRIVAFKFYLDIRSVNAKDKTKIVDIDSISDKLTDSDFFCIRSWGISQQTEQKLLSVVGGSDKLKEYVDFVKNSKNIENKAAYLVKAVSVKILDERKETTIHQENENKVEIERKRKVAEEREKIQLEALIKTLFD